MSTQIHPLVNAVIRAHIRQGLRQKMHLGFIAAGAEERNITDEDIQAAASANSISLPAGDQSAILGTDPAPAPTPAPTPTPAPSSHPILDWLAANGPAILKLVETILTVILPLLA